MANRLFQYEIDALDELGQASPPVVGAKFQNGLGTRIDEAMQAVADGSGDSDLADRVTAAEADIAALEATAITAPSAVSNTTPDIDWSLSGVFTLLTNGNETVTFSNLVDGKTILVRVTAAGAHTVTWPAAEWSGGAAPTQ